MVNGIPSEFFWWSEAEVVLNESFDWLSIGDESENLFISSETIQALLVVKFQVYEYLFECIIWIWKPRDGNAVMLISLFLVYEGSMEGRSFEYDK